MSIECLACRLFGAIAGTSRVIGGAIAAGVAILVLRAGWVWFMGATNCLGQDPAGDYIYQHAVHFAAADLADVPTSERKVLNSIGMQLTIIPPGEFIMGSPSSEWTRQAEERPHSVRITRPFYLGVHEVTVSQFRQFVEETGYQTVCETNGRGGFGVNLPDLAWRCHPEFSWRNCGLPQGDDHPVVNVSYDDALAFCRWLSRREGARYRLPTEAEWEYACRAGTMGPFWSRSRARRWPGESNVRQPNMPEFVKGNIPEYDGFEYTSPAGSFAANAFGLHDTHGNVEEWCADWYDSEYYAHSERDDPRGPATGSKRVVRGGSYFYFGLSARSAIRAARPPDLGGFTVGFRVAADAESLKRRSMILAQGNGGPMRR